MEISEPELPRHRKVPRRFEDNTADTDIYPTSPQEYYRRLYFEAIDLIMACIRNRFDQPGYRTHRNIEDLLLKTVNAEEYEEQLHTVTQLYTTA